MNVAPLSLAPSAYTASHADFPSGSFFSQSSSYPLEQTLQASFYSPASPNDPSHSPASSQGGLECLHAGGVYSASDRESSPASSFLPTPAGSPKMGDISVGTNWTSFEPFLERASKGPGAPNYSAVHAQQLAYQSQMLYQQQQQQQQQYYAAMQPQQAQPYYLPQQQQSFMSLAPVAAPQFAPSYETPQGTYFFVPASVLPVTQAPPQAQMNLMASAPLGSSPPSSAASSWEQLASIPLPPLEAALSPKEVKAVVSTIGGAKKAPKKKNTTKRFVCPHPGCGRAFARNFNLGSHVKSHLGIRDFNCPACPKKFSRRHDRARHCAAVHDLHHFVEEQDVCDDEA